MNHFTWVLIASTSFDALVAGGTLAYGAMRAGRNGGEPAVTPVTVLVAVLVTSLVFVAKLIPLRLVGLRFFGLVHLLYLDGVVVVPLIGLGLLVASRARRVGPRVRLHPVVSAAAAIALLAAPVGAYASFIEPHRLVMERCEVGLDGLEPLVSVPSIKIAVLADLQFRCVTEHEHMAVAMALAEEPDLIMLPGDLFQGTDAEFERELPAIRKLLGRLHAPVGVFVVQGDCERPERLRREIEGTDVVFLYDQIVDVTVKGTRMALAGTRREFWAPAVDEVVHRLASRAGDVDVTLLVSHRPGVVLDLPPRHAIDLVIAGHTHGGQVCVPFVGPLMTASRIPNSAAAGGLSRVNDTFLYVSRGVGCERHQAPVVRFFCPPEVSLLSLTSDPSDHPSLAR